MYNADCVAKEFFDKTVKRHEFNKKTAYYTVPQKVKFELYKKSVSRAKYHAIIAVAGKDCQLHEEVYTNYTECFIEDIFTEIRKLCEKEGYSIENNCDKSFCINLT